MPLRRLVATVLLAGLGLAPAAPAMAETLRVRSGEHGAFTRIVVDLQDPAEWRLGRIGDGYGLRVEGDGIRYDLAAAFAKISRARVAALRQGEVGDVLEIGLGCACHATAFTSEAGAIVIDIRDGDAPPDSPFEAPLAPRRVERAKPAPGAGDGDPDRNPAAALGSAFAAPPASAPLGASPGQGSAMPASPAAPRETAGRAPQPAPPAPSAPSAPPERAETRPGAADAPFRGRPAADPQLDLYWKRVLERDSAAEDGRTNAGASVATGETAPRPRPEAAAPAPRLALPPRGPAAPADPALLLNPAMPDPRLAEARQEIVRQLGRAAAQGLIRVEGNRHLALPPPPEPAAPGPAAGQPAAPPAAADGSAIVPAEPGVHAETSVDRDSLQVASRQALTHDGAACIEDSELDIAHWGDDRPVAVQIAQRRAGLVGEFDRPEERAVRDLVRLYLHLGFGAEARAVLDSFALQGEDLALLRDLAAILDDQPVPAGGALAGMAGCDTAAALWALMAGAAPATSRDVNTAAVERAFSALPFHLREQLGPELVRRLLAAGARDAARAIRDAIARAGEGSAGLRMIEARLDLASGQAAEAETVLDGLASGNDTVTPEAVILAIESRLERGRPVPPELSQAAGALAFELRHSPAAPDLQRAYILSLASIGDLRGALAAYDAWIEAGTQARQPEVLRQLFGFIVATADDAGFLEAYFANRSRLLAAAPGMALRLDLAERLAGLGFPRQVAALLDEESRRSERGRYVRALAALAEGDFETVTGLARGGEDPRLWALAAQAYERQGRPLDAAAAYRRAGQQAAETEARWQGGDWGHFTNDPASPYGRALAALELIPDRAPSADAAPEAPAPEGSQGAAPPEAGPLAQGRALLERSRKAREALAELLAATSAPAGN